MKIKIGPIEVEQDVVKDEALFEVYKNSPKDVEKYFEEKSKILDLTLKNIIGGKTMKMIRDFVFTLIAGIAFIGWSGYVFYVSKEVFVWEELTIGTAITLFLQALMIIFICFLPVIIIGGFIKLFELFSNMRKAKKEEKETKEAKKANTKK